MCLHRDGRCRCMCSFGIAPAFFFSPTVWCTRWLWLGALRNFQRGKENKRKHRAPTSVSDWCMQGSFSFYLVQGDTSFSLLFLCLCVRVSISVFFLSSLPDSFSHLYVMNSIPQWATVKSNSDLPATPPFLNTTIPASVKVSIVSSGWIREHISFSFQV